MYNKIPIIAECRSIIRPFSICLYIIDNIKIGVVII
jgi:hypothetical protein